MSRPDIVVVAPGGRGGNYQRLGEGLAAVEPPAWARMLAGYCRDRGHSVRVIDADALELSPATVAELVKAHAPLLACVAAYGHHPSASTQSMPEAGAICREVARLAPRVPTILVGGHVSALPERTMADEACTFACVGEGPATVDHLLRLLRGGGRISDVPGLVYRGGDGDIPSTRARRCST